MQARISQTAVRFRRRTRTHRKQRDGVFRAIDDPTRREILGILRVGQRTVGEIAENFRMSRPAVCALDAKPLRAVNDWLQDYALFWGESLQSLKSYMEEKP
jgi:DNA-binding transcriptional ArsR family regulator